jgi:hypothetical protein
VKQAKLELKVVFLHHNKQNRAGACSDLQVFAGNRGIAVTSTQIFSNGR